MSSNGNRAGFDRARSLQHFRASDQKRASLAHELASERFVDGTMTGIIRVIPETIVAVPLVEPAGMARHGIEGDAVQLTTTAQRGYTLPRDVPQPRRAMFSLASRFRHDHRAAKPFVHFEYHLGKWLVTNVAVMNR